MSDLPTQNLIFSIKQLPYVHPLGTPLYWQYDASGQLQKVVLAFLKRDLKEKEFLILRAYLEYAINAPCWQDGMGELKDLRLRIKTLTIEELDGWLSDCLSIWIDLL